MKARAVLRTAASQLLHVLGLILGVVVVSFALIKAAPGSVVDSLAPTNASVAYREHLARELGLHNAWIVQLWDYLRTLLHGDLGYSQYYHQPVLDVIRTRIPNTLLLSGTGFLISSVLGIWLGVMVSDRRSAKADRVVNVLALSGYAVPPFLLGILLVELFSVRLGWLPSYGMSTIGSFGQSTISHILDVARHMVLPVTAYTVYSLCLVFRVTKSKMQETLRAEYILYSRSKGLKKRRIRWRHALPHALNPVIAILGFNLGYLLAGTILIETVFGWPGLGLLLDTAVTTRDFALLMGLLLLSAMTVIVGNVLSDLAQRAIDPRLRTGRLPW